MIVIEQVTSVALVFVVLVLSVVELVAVLFVELIVVFFLFLFSVEQVVVVVLFVVLVADCYSFLLVTDIVFLSFQKRKGLVSKSRVLEIKKKMGFPLISEIS